VIPGHLGYHGAAPCQKEVWDAATSREVGAGAAGLKAIGDTIWSVHFGPMLMGRFDEPNLTLSGASADHEPL